MPTADLYCRVSTTVQKQKGTSLTSQERACRQLALDRGYSVRLTFSEDWPSDTLDRPQLHELRKQLKSKVPDALICYSTDRLSRNPIHLAILAEECDKAGSELIFVTEPLDNSPEGQLIRYVKGYAAQIEREKIRERSMRGRRERALQGKLMTGSDHLYGYSYNKETGKREVNEEEAAVVRLIFHLLVEEDLIVGRIGIKLAEMGILAPKGKRQWGRSTLGRLARQEAYTGRSFANRWQAVPAEKPDGKKHRYQNRLRRLRSTEEWIELPDATPPIISKELFDKAQRALDRHSQMAERNTKFNYLLRGRIVCGVCGRHYYGFPASRGRHYDRCAGKMKIVTLETCSNRFLRCEPFERQIWDKIRQALKTPELIIAEISRRREGIEDDTGSLLQAIDSRLQKVTQRESRLVKLYTFAKISEDVLTLESKLLADEREGLSAERGRLLARTSELKILDDAEEMIRSYCALAAANIDSFTFERKREALEALKIELIIFPDKVSLKGILPLGGVGTASQPAWQSDCR